ncbi:MAG: methyltransferase domain-containing protein [Methanobacteriaceae archaeon]|nr:methyltransferase domain-containing protein [Methanobacteriaceae archaeon]
MWCRGSKSYTGKKNPEAHITSIDISQESLDHAKATVKKEKVPNVQFQQADIMDLTFPNESFDHIFVCFVLEHLSSHKDALRELKRVLNKGGTITVIEGDHGSCYFHPETEAAKKVWNCLITCQKRLDCNPNIGHELYPIMEESGFKDIPITPRIVYADQSKPLLVDGFIKKTIIAMVAGVNEQALHLGLVDEKTWVRGIKDLYKTAGSGGTFFYNFLKGVGVK